MENAADKPASTSSHYVKTVVLRDWWLVRSREEYDGRTLAISGLPVDERAVRVFTSAPVVKRYSVFTLETADGVYVILKGFINRLRTEEGGFSSEVFKDFLLGFPLNWEQYARKKLVDDEYLRPMPCPSRTTVNGFDATVIPLKRTKNVASPAEVDIDAVKVTSCTPRNCDADELKKTLRHIGSDIEILTSTTESEQIPEQLFSCKHRSSETEVPPSANISKGTPLKLKNKQVAREERSENSGAKELSVDSRSMRGRKTVVPSSYEDISLEIPLKCESKKAMSRKHLDEKGGMVVETSKAFQNSGAPAAKNISAVQATPTAHNYKTISYSTNCETGATSRVKDVKAKLSFDAEVSPSIKEGLESPYLLSDVSSVKKSRSGRLLLRPLEFWRNQKAIYDGSRQITGIVSGTPDSVRVVLASGTRKSRKRKC